MPTCPTCRAAIERENALCTLCGATWVEGGVPDWLAEARGELAAGRTVSAIRLVKANLPLGLAEARDFVHGGRIHDSIPEPEPWVGVARRAMNEGKKIVAIKIVREHLGIGLREAKDLVESGGLDKL